MKEQWEAAIEDHPEARTLTDLIRISVTHELYDRQATDETVSDDPKLGEILEGVRSIQSAQEDLTSRIDQLEREVKHRPEVTNMAGRIYDRLPDLKPGIEDWKLHVERYRPEEYTVWPGTVEALAEALEEPEYRVREGAEYLAENDIDVRTETVGGEERFWRIE